MGISVSPYLKTDSLGGNGASSYAGYATPARPPAKTWQEQQEYDAQDAFAQQGAKTNATQDAASARRDAAQGSAQSALDSYNNIDQHHVADWSPTATAGYQPSQVAQWKASLGSLSAAPVSFGTTGSVGGVGGGYAGGGGASSELSKFDPSALTNFDPAAAGKEYAQGAYGDFESKLKGDLTTLTNKSVGSGRLNTGFFDTDQGNVVKSNAANFNNALAQAALQFSAQRESALQGGESLAYQRAAGIDANAITSTANANAASASLRADQLRAGEDANSFNLSKYGMGLSGAEYQDTQGYNKARALDTDRYGQATYLDNTALAQGQTGLEAALHREDEYNKESDTANDAAASYASANRGWAATDREAQDARDAVAKAKAGPYKGKPYGGSGVAASTGNNDPNARLAAIYGVPYRG